MTFEGLAAASVGWTETALRAEGRNIRIVHAHPANHAAYYPGAETMRLKLIVDADTDKILGAQGVGGSGVDKRIDVIATAMFAGITASNLAQLELAYDPQHGSAKDPVNMLGYINRNIAEGFTRTIEWHQLELFRNEGWEILESIQQAAARRLRPILMTSIATVFGAIPLAIASGAGGAARASIGVVIVFGVTLATLITLVLIPLIYARLAKYTGSPEAVTRRLQQELAEQEKGAA